MERGVSLFPPSRRARRRLWIVLVALACGCLAAVFINRALVSTASGRRSIVPDKLSADRRHYALANIADQQVSPAGPTSIISKSMPSVLVPMLAAPSPTAGPSRPSHSSARQDTLEQTAPTFYASPVSGNGSSRNATATLRPSAMPRNYPRPSAMPRNDPRTSAMPRNDTSLALRKASPSPGPRVPALRNLIATASFPLSKHTAVAIQCSPHWLPRWRALFAALAPRDRAALSVFVYVYGSPRESRKADAELRAWAGDAGSALAFATTPSTRGGGGGPVDTWAAGRNALARATYAAEVSRGRQFRWWAWADGDMAELTCLGCGGAAAQSAALSACCFRHALTAAATFPAFAIVSTWAIDHPHSLASPTTFWLRCGADAQLQVFARAAVPLFLPYHTELDGASWWASSDFMHWYCDACGLGRAGAAAVSSFLVRPLRNAHGGYPRKPYTRADVEAVLRRTFPGMARQFLAPPPSQAQAPRIKGLKPTVVDAPASSPSPAPLLPAWRFNVTPSLVAPWRASAEFSACIAERLPYFVAHIGGGVPEAPPPP